MTELVVIKQQHDRTLKFDYHEWYTPEVRVKADSRGRLNSRIYSASWSRWDCNNSDCPAWALVSDRAVQSLLEAAEA